MTQPATPRPSPARLQAFADGFNASKMLRSFGVTLSFPEGTDRVRAEITVTDIHAGGLGSKEAVNGGILAAIFDLVLGCAPALVDPDRRSATMHLSMNFERPTTGPVIAAEAWVDRAGRDTVFASANILDGKGQVTARAQGLVKFSTIPWANGVSPGAG